MDNIKEALAAEQGKQLQALGQYYMFNEQLIEARKNIVAHGTVIESLTALLKEDKE